MTVFSSKLRISWNTGLLNHANTNNLGSQKKSRELVYSPNSLYNA